MAGIFKRGIRKAVSADKVRFQNKQFDLDMTYITARLVAMSIPASGLDAVYRNDINEVAKMLTYYHGKDTFMLYNLSKIEYDYSKFGYQVLNYPFPDHHAPPLQLLFQIISSIDNWLNAGKENVAVVHCKGGKGRTGLVVACYLRFAGLAPDGETAMEMFAASRSNVDRGVTQVSQRRYVNYFNQLIEKRERPVPKPLHLTRVVMSNVPAWTKRGCRPIIEIHQVSPPKKLLYTTLKSDNTVFRETGSGSVIWFMPKDLVISGDICIKIRHLNRLLPTKSNFNLNRVTSESALINTSLDMTTPQKQIESIARFSFHTAFAPTDDINPQYLLDVNDLDMYNKSKKFLESLEEVGFTLRLQLAKSEGEEWNEKIKDAEAASKMYDKIYRQRGVTLKKNNWSSGRFTQLCSQVNTPTKRARKLKQNLPPIPTFVCATCRSPIQSAFVEALGLCYHTNHFMCDNCDKPILTDSFHHSGESAICNRCYSKIEEDPTLCPSCGERVAIPNPGDQSEDNGILAISRWWHKSCFNCNKCDLNFIKKKRKFFLQGGTAYCSDCVDLSVEFKDGYFKSEVLKASTKSYTKNRQKKLKATSPSKLRVSIKRNKHAVSKPQWNTTPKDERRQAKYDFLKRAKQRKISRCASSAIIKSQHFSYKPKRRPRPSSGGFLGVYRVSASPDSTPAQRRISWEADDTSQTKDSPLLDSGWNTPGIIIKVKRKITIMLNELELFLQARVHDITAATQKEVLSGLVKDFTMRIQTELDAIRSDLNIELKLNSPEVAKEKEISLLQRIQVTAISTIRSYLPVIQALKTIVLATQTQRELLILSRRIMHLHGQIFDANALNG